ncbi:hypothetical protein [Sporosarcina jiandibaonis]|nr:hypothetical protein [Sporosarcina jiandibaonis]
MVNSLLCRHNSIEYIEKRQKDLKEAKKNHQPTKSIEEQKKELLAKLK